jgi:hypothetical protein
MIMPTSGIIGKLISYDLEIKEMQVQDQEENELVTVTVRPDTFPFQVDWSEYIGEDLFIVLVNGKTYRIYLLEEPDEYFQKDTRYKYITDQPDFKQEMENLAWHIGGTMEFLNFKETGFIDYLFKHVYVAWYYGVEEVRTTGNFSFNEHFYLLPKKERKNIVSFLEYCIKNKAAIYWRDHDRFTWCIIDKKKYKDYCKRFGYRYSDFLWDSNAATIMHHLSH